MAFHLFEVVLSTEGRLDGRILAQAKRAEHQASLRLRSEPLDLGPDPELMSKRPVNGPKSARLGLPVALGELFEGEKQPLQHRLRLLALLVAASRLRQPLALDQQRAGAQEHDGLARQPLRGSKAHEVHRETSQNATNATTLATYKCQHMSPNF